jgi:farnesyl diphosphate synthase
MNPITMNPHAINHTATSMPAAGGATPEDLAGLITTSTTRVRQTLHRWLPAADCKPAQLHQAMRYAALSGGKYVRPLLVYATGQSLGQAIDTLDGPACAVELVHAYSLVHDDLPAMDDDDLRRGQPTCHKAYGEAMAILAGDALQTLAFDILSQDPAMTASAEQRLAMISTLARASGSLGMAGGQAIDLLAAGTADDMVINDLPALEDMHNHKTGALIRCSVRLAALNCTTCDNTVQQQLNTYAGCIGLAFQIRDDILDIEGDTATLGKPQGSDIARNKPTYPALLGLDGARRKAQDMHEQALAALESLGPLAEPLRWISAYIVQRDK